MWQCWKVLTECIPRMLHGKFKRWSPYISRYAIKDVPSCGGLILSEAPSIREIRSVYLFVHSEHMPAVRPWGFKVQEECSRTLNMFGVSIALYGKDCWEWSSYVSNANAISVWDLTFCVLSRSGTFYYDNNFFISRPSAAGFTPTFQSLCQSGHKLAAGPGRT